MFNPEKINFDKIYQYLYKVACIIGLNLRFCP